MKHSRLDWILVACFAALALWSGYKLYAPSSSRTFDGESFAHLESLTNVVKSKALGELGWSDARSGQGFNRKDQVFTYQNSKAVLNFSDGQNLTLLPNTLVELDQNQGTLALQVKEGLVYLDLKPGKSVSLEMGGQEVTLKGSENSRVKLSKLQGKLKLEGSQGDVQVTNASGESAKLDNQSSVSIDSEQKFVVRKFDINNPIPADGTILDRATLPSLVKFSYDVGQKIKTNVELAQDYAFNQKISPNSALETGTYYWRVVDEDALAVSSVYSFELRHNPAPWFMAVEKTKEIILSDGEIKFELDWNHPSALEYELVISVNGDESTEETQAKKAAIKIDEIGDYKVRVRAVRPALSPWSETFNVFVREPAPIEPISPKHNEQIALTKPGEFVTLTFDGNAEIEIASDPDFDDILIKETARDEYQWQVAKTGTYFWRIRKGKQISPTRNLIINPSDPLPPPQLKRVPGTIKLKVVKPTSWLNYFVTPAYAQDFVADFEWQEVEGAKAYEIFFYRDPEGKNLLHQVKSDENFYSWLGAPLATVWWRVRAIDAWDRAGQMSVFVETKLLPPSGWESTDIALSTPAHGFSIEEKNAVTFSWDKTPGVDQWQWLLSADLSFKKPMRREQTSDNQITLENLPAGVWYWRVRATDKLGRVLESRRRRIEITIPDPVEVAKKEQRKIEYQARIKFRSPFDGEIGLLATKPSYELTRGRQTFTLSGVSASGVHLNLSRGWDKWRGLMDLKWITGKAFESLGYNDNQLRLMLERPWDIGLNYPVWGAFGLSYARLSSYKRAASSNELSEETLSTLGVAASVTIEPWRWENNIVRLTGQIIGPSRLGIGFDIKHYRKNWYWGAGFERTSLEDDGEISVTTMLFNLGYRWQR